MTICFCACMQDIRERDARDSQRATAPLKPAPGAHVLDTSGLSREQALEAALGVVKAACPWLLGSSK